MRTMHRTKLPGICKRRCSLYRYAFCLNLSCFTLGTTKLHFVLTLLLLLLLFFFFFFSSQQNQLQEAESCVQDCRDCPATELAHELATADRAIDQAVQRLLDVLEGSRSAPNTTSMPTEEWVQRIKQLRAQVKQLQPSSEPSANVTNTTTTAP